MSQKLTLIEARRKYYNEIKDKTNAILNKYKHYKFFENVLRELNDPAFYMDDDIYDEIKHHDTNGYVVDMHDVNELRRMLNLLNNMRNWKTDDPTYDNHPSLVANLSELMQAINSTDPHKIGSMHISKFGEKVVINYGGGKKRSNEHSKKHSKKNRHRRTTSHRRRSRAAR
jgi:hypothetical protein